MGVPFIAGLTSGTIMQTTMRAHDYDVQSRIAAELLLIVAGVVGTMAFPIGSAGKGFDGAGCFLLSLWVAFTGAFAMAEGAFYNVASLLAASTVGKTHIGILLVCVIAYKGLAAFAKQPQQQERQCAHCKSTIGASKCTTRLCAGCCIKAGSAPFCATHKLLAAQQQQLP